VEQLRRIGKSQEVHVSIAFADWFALSDAWAGQFMGLCVKAASMPWNAISCTAGTGISVAVISQEFPRHVRAPKKARTRAGEEEENASC